MSQLQRLSSGIREQAAQDKQAYEQGSRKVLADKRALARQAAEPAPMVQAGATVMDGLMEIYERKNQVVIAIKETAIDIKETAATLDVYA